MTGVPAGVPEGTDAGLLELTAGPVAHGGHVVGRVGDDPDGRVVFVRHALPGERVRVRLTDAGPDRRFWRGDAVEVLEASPDRVTPPCPYAGPGRCGGCDFQHAALPAQRRLKADVVTEQLQRLGHVDLAEVLGAPLEVEALPEPGRAPGEETGLGWRTRVRYGVDPSGRLGFHAHREHRVVAVEHCPLTTAGVDATGVTRLPWPGVAAVQVAEGDDGAVVQADPPRAPRARRGGSARPGGSRRSQQHGPDGTPGTAPARRPRLPRVDALGLVLGGPDGGRVAGRTWVRHAVPGAGSFRVSSDGFWQVHAAAAPTLVRLVREAAALRPDDTVLDLYAGAGLLSLALAGDLGPDGSVVAVESDPSGVQDLRRNAHDEPRLRVVAARVEHALDDVPAHVDVVVLDPPRAGAGAAVLDRLAGLGPRRVVVVSCDPAALGRDTALLAERGYRLAGLRALDAFPMTHHVECVAAYDLIS